MKIKPVIRVLLPLAFIVVVALGARALNEPAPHEGWTKANFR